MATLEDLQAELARRTQQSAQPASAPAAPQMGVTAEDIQAELARRKQVASQPAAAPQSGGWFQTADDVVRRMANAATFGFADKLAAGGNAALGQGDYGSNLKAERAQSQQAGQRLGTAGTLASDVAGGVLPAMLNPVSAATMIPRGASLGAKMLGFGLEGAGYGALAGAGNTDTGNPMDYVKNAAKDAAFGGVVGAAVPAVATAAKRVITPMPSNLSPEQQRLAKVLEAEGINLSASQKTGSRPLAFAEDQVSKLPLTSLGAANPREGQMNQFTQAVLKKAGITGADAATPDVIDQGFRDVGSRIGDITGKYNGSVDPQFSQDLRSIADNFAINLSDAQRSQMNEYVNRLFGQNGTFSGADYQKLRSQLGGLMRSLTNAENQQYRSALGALQNAMDDLMERSIVKGGKYIPAPNGANVINPDIAALQEARQQYANLNVLSKALNRSGQAGATGDLTPAALEGALKSSVGGRAYSRGAGELNDLARGGSALLRTPPDSGTATREAITKAVELPAMMAGGYAVGGPVGAGAVLAGLPTLGYAVNGKIPQMYLANQLLAKPVDPKWIGPAVGGLLGAEEPVREKRRKNISVDFPNWSN